MRSHAKRPQDQFGHGRDKNHAVKAVEHAAMPWEDMAVILNAGLPLDDGERQVAHLADGRAGRAMSAAAP